MGLHWTEQFLQSKQSAKGTSNPMGMDQDATNLFFIIYLEYIKNVNDEYVQIEIIYISN